MHPLVSSAFFFWATLVTICGLEVDPKGYIVYCPCMGKFEPGIVNVTLYVGCPLVSEELGNCLIIITLML